MFDEFRERVLSVLDARPDLHHITDAEELAFELAYLDIGFENANIELLINATTEWLSRR